MPGKDVHIPIQTGDPVTGVANHRRFSSQFNKEKYGLASSIEITCSYVVGLGNPKNIKKTKLPVLRIRDVYPGSEFFFIPDPHRRIQVF